MTRTYELDTTAAKEANTGGKRITEPGMYTGRFRAAWYEKNDKGTENVNLIFVNDAGQEAGPLSLYTHNGKGEELPGYKMLNAIMVCMRLRALSTKSGQVRLWDADSKTEVEKRKDIYPMLCGVPVGLVLSGEEYENRNGEVKQRLVIAAPFDKDTKRMADEVLVKATEAVALQKFTDWLTKSDRWIKPLTNQRKTSPKSSKASQETHDAFDDDPVPF